MDRVLAAMPEVLHAGRIRMQDMGEGDARFMLALLNSPGWLEYIGDRGVHDASDAIRFIQTIAEDPTKHYWTIFDREQGTPLGVLTLVQRENLDGPDVGFALLPEHQGSGYGFEAALCLVQYLRDATPEVPVLGITRPGNEPSIRLLRRLGMKEQMEMDREGERLVVFRLG